MAGAPVDTPFVVTRPACRLHRERAEAYGDAVVIPPTTVSQTQFTPTLFTPLCRDCAVLLDVACAGVTTGMAQSAP